METSAPSSAPVRFPTFTRLRRCLFSWRVLRRCLVALAVLITLVALFYTGEAWRGKRAWENYRDKLVAEGMQMDLKAYLPPPVPDDQNFAMTPFLAPLLEFNPQPLQPGQTAWRDTNGLERARNFAQEVPLENHPPEYLPDFGGGVDFRAFLLKLHGKTNVDRPALSFCFAGRCG